MKKTLALALAVVMSLGLLAGCGGNGGNGGNSGNTSNPPGVDDKGVHLLGDEGVDLLVLLGLSYIMIQGDPENIDAQLRTEYSVKALKDAGIEVEELDLQRGGLHGGDDGVGGGGHAGVDDQSVHTLGDEGVDLLVLLVLVVVDRRGHGG